jgi:hypothetical protein
LLQSLTKNMIRFTINERPTIKEIKSFPYFWDASKILLFIRDFSKCLEVCYQKKDNELFKALTIRSNQIVGNDWTQLITEQAIRKEMEKNYKDKIVVDEENEGEAETKKLGIQKLIRTIRNLVSSFIRPV